MTDPSITDLYPSLSDDMECMLIFPRGAIAFRFGPLRAKDVGPHLTKALELGVDVAVSFHCGPDVDWNLIADLNGKGPAAKAEQEAK